MNTGYKIDEIKTFSPEIYNFICRLTKQLSPNLKGPSEDAFRSILDSENTHLFVIQDIEGILAGMLTVVTYRIPAGYKAWIEDVVVDDAYRGRGYGKKIVEYAINFTRNSGVDTLSLTSNPSRIAANQLYQVLGFEKYETNVYRMKL